MSVTLARQIVDGLRAHGVVVHEAPGCWSRGNGQQFDLANLGCSLHHTATAFGFAPSILVNGRPDLSGPLCNTAGNVDGSVTLIAAFPANHAGAGGGRAMGPCPRTRNFNRCMWGHEIVYPGTVPMTPAQYRTACILGGIVSGNRGRPNADWVREHYETSETGKWDPGYAPNRTYDGNRIRADVWPALHSGAPVPAPAPAPPPPPRKDWIRMRSLSLDNPIGQTPNRQGVLTIDAVGTSGLMPAGAEAYFQWHASWFGFDINTVPENMRPLFQWLVFCGFDGKPLPKGQVAPFWLPDRASGAIKLPGGTASVEARVTNVPAGGAIGMHIDGRGHAT